MGQTSFSMNISRLHSTGELQNSMGMRVSIPQYILDEDSRHKRHAKPSEKDVSTYKTYFSAFSVVILSRYTYSNFLKAPAQFNELPM